MAGLWSRVTGRGEPSAAEQLAADLKVATESRLTDIPEVLIAPLIEASNTEEGRQDLMRHLCECLADSRWNKWHRAHAGMQLVEELMKRGNRALLVETAQGRHFDVVFRLSFIEKFEHNDNAVQRIVRKKAAKLRADLAPRLQGVDEGDCQKDTASSGTAVASLTSQSTDAASLASARGQMVLGGVVVVGHNDDTDSDSSGEEAMPGAVRFREVRRPKGPAPPTSAATWAAPADRAQSGSLAAPVVDLLDF